MIDRTHVTTYDDAYAMQRERIVTAEGRTLLALEPLEDRPNVHRDPTNGSHYARTEHLTHLFRLDDWMARETREIFDALAHDANLPYAAACRLFHPLDFDDRPLWSYVLLHDGEPILETSSATGIVVRAVQDLTPPPLLLTFTPMTSVLEQEKEAEDPDYLAPSTRVHLFRMYHQDDTSFVTTDPLKELRMSVSAADVDWHATLVGTREGRNLHDRLTEYVRTLPSEGVRRMQAFYDAFGINGSSINLDILQNPTLAQSG